MRDGDVAPAVDFIGIGAARSGTSWLVNMLREHPQICPSEPKEVRYFNRYLTPIAPDRGRENPNFGRSLDARGFHSFPTFEDAVGSEPGYLTMGLYAQQLTRFLAHFERRQLMVLIFEELVASPADEMKRLFRFLGVASDWTPGPSSRHTNPATGLRSRAVNDVAYRFSRAVVSAGGATWLGRMRRLGVYKLWHAMMSKPRRHPALQLETRSELERYFRDDVAELERLLGRDLRVWRGGAEPP